MTHEPKNFTITDPREFDGDPFEVADRAVAQLSALAGLTRDAVDAARLMARNAELERQCQRDEALDAPGWPDSAEGRRWQRVEDALEAVSTDLGVLRRVAAFNPKRPPREL